MFEIGQCNVAYVKGFLDHEVTEGSLNKNTIEEVTLMRKSSKKLVMRILNETIVPKPFFSSIFYRPILRLVTERTYLIIQSGLATTLCVPNLKCQFLIFLMTSHIILTLCLRETGTPEGML